MAPNPSVYGLILFDNKIFAGVNDTSGIFCSTDFGSSWQPLNDGLDGGYIQSYAANNDYLFAASYSKVYLLRRQDMKWQDIASNLTGISNLAVCGGDLFVGSWSGLWYRSISEITDIKREIDNPKVYVLSQNSPNPFNPTT